MHKPYTYTLAHTNVCTAVEIDIISVINIKS